jgi:catechol 2,3-dioxygenase-like lactoylglutathione lyase family enzyme
MLITGLFHAAIRTADLAATIAFYTRVLGLREVPRPAAIKFPGAWLAVPTPVGEAVIHVYAGSAAADSDGIVPADNERGTLDHLAVTAQGYTAFRERMREHGLQFREQNLAGTPSWQMFVHDPNGIKIELQFHEGAEPDLPVQIPDANRYQARERFFRREDYRQFSAS